MDNLLAILERGKELADALYDAEMQQALEREQERAAEVVKIIELATEFMPELREYCKPHGLLLYEDYAGRKLYSMQAVLDERCGVALRWKFYIGYQDGRPESLGDVGELWVNRIRLVQDDDDPLGYSLQYAKVGQVVKGPGQSLRDWFAVALYEASLQMDAHYADGLRAQLLELREQAAKRRDEAERQQAAKRRDEAERQQALEKERAGRFDDWDEMLDSNLHEFNAAAWVTARALVDIARSLDKLASREV